jgi:nifR3 family TIM-barrel protein
MSFWDSLQRPILALAPMADVTDAAFRRIIAKYSKTNVRDPGLEQVGYMPYVTWTEFVSADGLALAPEEGRKKLMADLIYSDAERPIVAQFFGSRPENMEKAAALARELGFDGVDINMGCPDKSIEKQGAGAAHMKDPSHAQEIIAAAKAGAQHVPVSVKTRLGYNKDELEEWLPKVLAADPVAVTVHARTRKEMSLVPARWERVKRAVEIRNELGSKAKILGNGDIKNVPDALQKIADTGADGAMLGRAIFGNPWLFAPQAPELPERLRVMVEHTKLYEELLPHKSFSIMKKHYKAYVSGFDGAAELRAELMNAPNAEVISECVEKWLATHTRGGSVS